MAAAARGSASGGLYGVLLSLDGAGSLLGLLLVSRAGAPLARRITVLAWLAPVLTLPLLLAHGALGLAAAAVALGLPVAPLVAALDTGVARVEHSRRHNAAFASLVTGQNLAGALGFATGGALVAHLGSRAPTVAGVAVLACAAIVLLPSARRALGP